MAVATLLKSAVGVRLMRIEDRFNLTTHYALTTSRGIDERLFADLAAALAAYRAEVSASLDDPGALKSSVFNLMNARRGPGR